MQRAEYENSSCDTLGARILSADCKVWYANRHLRVNADGDCVGSEKIHGSALVQTTLCEFVQRQHASARFA